MEESKVMIWQWIADGRMNNGKLQIDRQINKGINKRFCNLKQSKKFKPVTKDIGLLSNGWLYCPIWIVYLK